MPINLNTSNDTLRKLFGNGVAYKIPPFQRDYSWESTHWGKKFPDFLRIFWNSRNQFSRKSDLFKTIRNAFEEKEWIIKQSRNKKVVRYILFQLEKSVSGHAYDFEDDSITIEHICPESCESDAWPQEMEKYVHHLGNMTLLKKKGNEEAGTKPYCEKKTLYRSSDFQITRSIPEHYQTWDENKIISRQSHLAKRAVSIWRV